MKFWSREQGGVKEQDQGLNTNMSMSSLTLKLRYPEDDMSPKWKKARRKKVLDNLKQATLDSLISKSKIYSSDGVLPFSSGGPWLLKKSERGTKRVVGKQMEGPAGKRRRD